MVFGTPITWLIADVLSLILFVICLVHASRQENGTIRILELFGFVMFSAIFENIGVHSGLYDYDLNRIMMLGKVPLQITFLEGAIFYVALELTDYLNIPNLAKPFVVALFGVVQDMTLDPAVIYDLHPLDGLMRSQWNWAHNYDGTFFGIPWFNFSGWFFFNLTFVFAILIMRWLCKKTRSEILINLYPFLAVIIGLLLIVSPITRFLTVGEPIFPSHTRNAELGIMLFNLLVGLVLLLRYQKIDRPFDFKKNWIVFVFPVFLHLYDIVISFVLGLKEAYVPVLVFSAIHFAYLGYVYYKGKSLESAVRA
jgi:uncharacterized membrane protein